MLSSVDAKTDALIQRVTRERFARHTVIAIVHKLETAADDFDAVALLDAGELREFGPPRELLGRGPAGSAFAALHKSLARNRAGDDEEEDTTVASGSE
jgi:ATP-binding cassette subfamily C (CFTR/MRP) protein 1